MRVSIVEGRACGSSAMRESASKSLSPSPASDRERRTTNNAARESCDAGGETIHTSEKISVTKRRYEEPKTFEKPSSCTRRCEAERWSAAVIGGEGGPLADEGARGVGVGAGASSFTSKHNGAKNQTATPTTRIKAKSTLAKRFLPHCSTPLPLLAPPPFC